MQLPQSSFWGSLLFSSSRKELNSFGQYRDALERYRKSGMEYATVVTKQHDDQTLLYRYLESILSQEVESMEGIANDSTKKIQAQAKTKALLQLTREFQDTKEFLLVYEKKMVKWAAETKLFLLTKSDLIDVKKEAISSDLPEEDFSESIEELNDRQSFSHTELARWQNYFIRHKREDLAKRINPMVGTESGTHKTGEINNLTSIIQDSAITQYPDILTKQENRFSTILSDYKASFILSKSEADFKKAKDALSEYLAKCPTLQRKTDHLGPDQRLPSPSGIQRIPPG